jgi:alkylmercury lyase
MSTATPSTLAAELTAAMGALDEREQHLAVTLYRVLAEGEPAAQSELVRRSGLAADDVGEALERWPGVFTDEDGRVVGFWGLSVRQMAHELELGGRRLYAWCALDTLFLPELLGATAQVRSTCPATGKRISLTVGSRTTTDVAPPETVMSFLHRDEPFDAEVITTFCHYVHFFANRIAAEDWTSTRDGTFVISISDAAEIARLANAGRYPATLAG